MPMLYLLCLLVLNACSPASPQPTVIVPSAAIPTPFATRVTPTPIPTLAPTLFSTPSPAPSLQPVVPTPQPMASTQASPSPWRSQGGGGSGSHSGGALPITPTPTPYPVLTALPLVWEHIPEEAQAPFFQVPTVDQQAIYYGLYPNRIVAIGRDGVLKWDVESHTSPAGNVVVNSEGHTFVGLAYALFESFDQEGFRRWLSSVQESPIVGVGYYAQQDIFYAISEDGFISAIDSGGTSQWFRELFTRIATPPVVTHKQQILIGSEEGRWFALDAFTGEQRWAFLGEGPISLGSSATVGHNMLYLAHQTGTIHAVSMRGIHQWTFRTHQKIIGSVLESPEGILFAVTQNEIYALYPNGQLAWKKAIGQPIQHSSPVLDQEGFIYIAGTQDLLAYDSSGQLRLKQPLTETVTGGLTLDESGNLYLLGVSGRLQVYTSLGGGLPQTGWPKAMGNMQNWGYMNKGEIQ